MYYLNGDDTHGRCMLLYRSVLSDAVITGAESKVGDVWGLEARIRLKKEGLTHSPAHDGRRVDAHDGQMGLSGLSDKSSRDTSGTRPLSFTYVRLLSADLEVVEQVDQGALGRDCERVPQGDAAHGPPILCGDRHVTPHVNRLSSAHMPNALLLVASRRLLNGRLRRVPGGRL